MTVTPIHDQWQVARDQISFSKSTRTAAIFKEQRERLSGIMTRVEEFASEKGREKLIEGIRQRILPHAQAEARELLAHGMNKNEP